MKNIYVFCEGQTEESFVNKVLYDYFFRAEIVLIPIICETSRKAGKKHKGGVSNYEKLKWELTNLCKSHRNEYVTTMFDYYAMPDNTPDINNRERDIQKRMYEIEKAINDDIGQNNCLFHFMLHEFEGILFSNPDSFHLIADDGVVQEIQRVRDLFPTPEYINNSPATAPSKRLEDLIPNYAKVTNGTLLTQDMGLDLIMSQCQHFREWIQKLLMLR